MDAPRNATTAPLANATPDAGGGGATIAAAREIEDELAALAADVPESEWAKLPDDLTDNLDHYLYGTPKIGGAA